MSKYSENCKTVAFVQNARETYDILRGRKRVECGLMGLQEKRKNISKELEDKIARGVVSEEYIARKRACIDKIDAILDKYRDRIH